METFLTISVICLWVFVAILLVVMFMTIKLVVEFLNRYPVQHGTSASASPALMIGQKAPKFHGVDQQGQLFSSEENGERQTLVLFTAEGCALCEKVVSQVHVLKERHSDIRLVVVEQAMNPDGEGKQIDPSIPYLRSEEIVNKYGIKRAPSFAVIDSYGFLAELDTISSFKELELRIQKISDKAS